MGFSREVVVTGLGVVSPIGIGCDALWHSLMDGRSGIQPIRRFDPEPNPVTIGGELTDFDPKQHVRPRKALKVMCREIQTAFAAAAMAAEQAGIAPGGVDPDRMGTVFGSEMMYGQIDEFADLYRACHVDGEFQYDRYGEQFMSRVYPLWMLRHLPNMAACHVGIANDARGPNNSIVAGDASGVHAMVEAIRLLDRGAADVMFVGATGTRVGLTGWMYRGNLAVSKSKRDPAEVSRPFDADRDGMVNAEGAAVLILESLQHARQRQVTPLARVTDFALGMTTDDSAASRQNLLKRILRDVTASSAAVGHVNAHGLSTVEDDRDEAQAIQAVLGDVPVTALKSYHGNLGPASSLAEMIGSILAIQHRVVPRTLNYETPDPQCPISVVAEPLEGNAADSFIKLSWSATGQTAGVRLERPDA